MGHFGVKKTEDVLAAHFFWPRMRRDVERFVGRCTWFIYASSCSQCALGGYFYGLCFGIASHRREGIVFLLLWIDFLKWHTLFLITKLMMLHMLLICCFVKLFICMVCQILQFLIVSLNLLAIFGDAYGQSCGLSCCLVLHVIPKLMDKLKWLKQNLKKWEECLPHIEFAYNRSMHSTTKMCQIGRAHV